MFYVCVQYSVFTRYENNLYLEQQNGTITTVLTVIWSWGKIEKNTFGSLSDKSRSPLLCPSLFVGQQWWLQSCQPLVNHRASQESPEAEKVWLTDSKSHCSSMSDCLDSNRLLLLSLYVFMQPLPETHWSSSLHDSKPVLCKNCSNHQKE